LDREPKYTLSELLRALTDRCAELDLRLRAQSAGVEVTAFLATLASHYRLTGKFNNPNLWFRYENVTKFWFCSIPRARRRRIKIYEGTENRRLGRRSSCHRRAQETRTRIRTIGVWDEPGMIIDEIKANPPDVRL